MTWKQWSWLRTISEIPTIHTLTTLVGGIELLTEITAVGVLLMALDRLAVAIRFTYRAGFLVGTIWHRYGVPATIKTADAVSWLIAQVDWAEVRSNVAEMLRILLALTITAAIWSRQALIAMSAALGRRYAALIAQPQRSTDQHPIAAPVVHPLALMAEELGSLSCKQLRSEFGLRLKTSKVKLIGAALAC